MGSISTLNAFSKVRFLPLAHSKVDRLCCKKSKFENFDKLQGQKRITCEEGTRQFFSPLPSTIQGLSNVTVGELCDEGFGGHSPQNWAPNVNTENFKLPYLH